MSKDQAIGWSKRELAARVAHDLKDGWFVNLGIGLPTLVADYIPEGREIILHSENGLLGLGPKPAQGEEDPDLVNAGKEPITIEPGGCFFSQADSFAMIRGGHLDATILGAFQVSQYGDLASWKLPNSPLGRVGGAMDLTASSKRVFLCMQHTSKGTPKIVEECSYPLTAPRCVDRIYTDLAVIDVIDAGLVVLELAPGVTFEYLQERTAAPLKQVDKESETIGVQQ
ncbi:3-oxoacid CoA-transferase subunit B [Neobacillus bataviensis LMG 21833]|uniref:3-oxoacid CoA-transferase subunit B n=1 Tax=Neobacillus bataviensis LMG 21833 TaxID=1117379 RepID=K6C679_9BACI|nr:3-oxoacid CoA-transferase subunit B [Neobacillus bataviensis]EKN66620.1 3-oxoacid CoA-transferase subunit B [Neobacillus bataviensis LMG 21833]